MNRLLKQTIGFPVKCQRYDHIVICGANLLRILFPQAVYLDERGPVLSLLLQASRAVCLLGSRWSALFIVNFVYTGLITHS
jgi:hypothetical protein